MIIDDIKPIIEIVYKNNNRLAVLNSGVEAGPKGECSFNNPAY